MKRELYLSCLGKIFGECLRLIATKSRGYATEENGFANFDNAANFAGSTAEVGLRLRIGDKISRLGNFFGGANMDVSNETVEDTITDLICYLAILLLERRGRDSMLTAAVKVVGKPLVDAAVHAVEHVTEEVQHEEPAGAEAPKDWLQKLFSKR